MWKVMTILLCLATIPFAQITATNSGNVPRERIAINKGWRFFKYDSRAMADSLIYDVRPEVKEHDDDKPADSKPTEAEGVVSKNKVLKPWIIPTGNDFIADPAKRYERPEGNPGGDFPFVQLNFDDNAWEQVDLPHDWAIDGPFLEGWDTEVSGGMGRLPSPGVAWYRKKLEIPASDANKLFFLDVDGAMSYAMVWLNGRLVGGWPFGYASWRLDLTPYMKPGRVNQLAIRLDNPNHSSRWYPGGGMYRNVWLVKTNPVHIGHWGTFVTTPDVTENSATISVKVTIDNESSRSAKVVALTDIFAIDKNNENSRKQVASVNPMEAKISANGNGQINGSVTIEDPNLWGPPPSQTPRMYVAVTTLKQKDKIVDRYETKFGIRSLKFDPNKGLFVNGEHIYIKGVNKHHDLGALGAAFNKRAAERQLEKFREMGVNAIRTAHNPPAPEFLELTDRMGFLVIDETFDVWKRKKTPLDFHLIFPDWHEQDLRALVRRDRNHPSVIMWSTGNEVGEQYTDREGAKLADSLNNIVKGEDPTRPTTTSMNFAKPPMGFPDPVEIISLNYQGEGIRNAPAYDHLEGINTEPLYPSFHQTYPEKVIISSENAAALSSRGTYIFPVYDGISAPVSDSTGGDPENQYVSAYELYTAEFGSSADKVFRSLEQHPYVAGGFVWAGWDYLGEPTPYYGARSSYFGIIDLAGFKKDRFYLYQSRWRPDHKMAHILPHWNWPDRIGEVTPVHVFTSGDEAELFLNDRSLGRESKDEYQYRLRWDDVKYQPGELRVVAYKDGKQWAEDVVITTGEPSHLVAAADRSVIKADGRDLSFIEVTVADSNGLTVPTADNKITFSIEGPGEIVATDNGDPTNMTPFPSHERHAFNGRVLAIVRSGSVNAGEVTVTIESPGLKKSRVTVFVE
ncbi:MAG: DUF4982 domain-containing protein [Candidatus Marinimicrobia bacterium]|nr:DUF4982 domain-containing protein [Candidatus Neomarinimicrobiota bacterium]MCF7880609.1 DUF4982 domain-containing protein [Candidatus Neomarinimicrobiota bacterium]